MLLEVAEFLGVLSYGRLGIGLEGLELLDALSLKMLHQVAQTAAEPVDHVLVDTHRAYDRAVDTAQQERDKQNADYDSEIESQQRGQELEFCHPAEPVMADSRKQKRDSHQEQHR